MLERAKEQESVERERELKGRGELLTVKGNYEGEGDGVKEPFVTVRNQVP